MKKMKTLLAGAALTLLTAGSALATNIPGLPTNYSWVNAAFWSPTDSTTPPYQGNSTFDLYLESFGKKKDASFGLFSVADASNPANPTKFQVFNAAAEPTKSGMPTNQTVSFRDEGGVFQVSLDKKNWTDFSRTFGFYFDFVDTNNSKLNNSYYSYLGLDTDKDDRLNVLTAHNDSSQVLIYLDQDGIASQSYEMLIGGNDLAPVPEPGTMMLLGAGMLGLAIYGKRRKNA